MKKPSSKSRAFPTDLPPFQVPAAASARVQALYAPHATITPLVMAANLYTIFALHLQDGLERHQRFNTPIADSDDVVLAKVDQLEPPLAEILGSQSPKKRRSTHTPEQRIVAHPRDVYKLCLRWLHQQLVDVTQQTYTGGHDLADDWFAVQACNYTPGQPAGMMLTRGWRATLQAPNTSNPFFLMQIVEMARDAGHDPQQSGLPANRWLSQFYLDQLQADVVNGFDFTWWRRAIQYRDLGPTWSDPLGSLYESWLTRWEDPHTVRLEMVSHR